MTRELIKALRRYSTFSVTSHINVEGDALGSQIAVYSLLKKMGKNVVMINQDPVPASYRFLPGSSSIKTAAPQHTVDVSITVDCSDLFRTGTMQEYLKRAPVLINIDHHISNSYFGTINWVDGKASSACEMVYHLCSRLNMLDKDIATCLYTGIFTDTGSFIYSNTTPAVHSIISRLLSFGIVPQKIHHAIQSVYELKDLRLISVLLSKVKQDPSGRLAWLTTADWPVRSSYDLSETLFSLMRLLKKAEVFIIIKQTPSKDIRVNFRSKCRLDVNKIARLFGGGGHCTASGATVRGSITKIERDVIRAIKKHW